MPEYTRLEVSILRHFLSVNVGIITYKLSCFSHPCSELICLKIRLFLRKRVGIGEKTGHTEATGRTTTTLSVFLLEVVTGLAGFGLTQVTATDPTDGIIGLRHDPNVFINGSVEEGKASSVELGGEA